MSEYVVMPKEDWKGICDSVRAKTEKTDLMTSDMVATEISGISDLTAELMEQDELLISIEAMLGLSADNIKAITTPEEFMNMDPDGMYYLANDITISTSVNLFRGTLCGNDKMVTTTAPLFNTLDGATVYDLTISGRIDMSGVNRVGALACNGSNVRIHHVTNLANVSGARQVAGIVGFASGDPTFTWCVNKGNIHASERHVGGIVAVATENITMRYCANSGNITLADTVSSSSYRYGAAGIVDWAGTGCLLYYCVNTGNIFSTFNAAGIGCNLEGEYIVVEGCVNTGRIHSDALDVAGIVRRVEGRAYINFNTIAGSLTADSGNASAVVHYNQSSSSSYQNNIVLLEQGDVRGIDEYLIVGTTGSVVTEQSENVACVYAIKGTFEKLFKPNGKNEVQIPDDYEYYFKREELTSDEVVKEKFGEVFALSEGIPMHKDVVDVYRLACAPRNGVPAVLTVTFKTFDFEVDDYVAAPHYGYYILSHDGMDHEATAYFEAETTLTISTYVGGGIDICSTAEPDKDYGCDALNEEGCRTDCYSHGRIYIEIEEPVASVTIHTLEV